MAEKKSAAKPSTKAAVKETAQAKVKTADTKKEASAESVAAATKKKPSARKSGTVKKTTKTEPTVKAETKKTSAAKAVKEEKPAAKKPAAKTAKAKAPAAGKSTASKPAAKKTAAKKPAAKTTAAKTTSKKAKLEQYESLSLDTCIAMMQAMGITYTYDDYAATLMNEADLGAIEKKLLDDFRLTKTSFSYEDDGYDVDLIKVVLSKIADTVDFKASDYPKMEADAAAAINYVIGTDMEKDGEEYLSEFHLWERLLMIAQRQGHRTEEELGSVIKVDLKAFMKHFMQLARTVLPQWQYDDVKYYENFAYALLSQFTDLFGIYNNELMMDVADLYILHEDYRHGDADYGYLIRENQIKDYVYYRFAHVYEDIDLDKAKGIAYESLQYVDGRYDYYQPIIDILNRQ